MKRKALLLALLATLLMGSCLSSNIKEVSTKLNDSNFWFALDPLILTNSDSHRIKTFISGKKDFDSLFLKSEILIQSIEKGIASYHYKKEQINYEIKQTISQIDSLDPINSFSGPDIVRAEKAYYVMLEKRQKLLSLIQEENING